MYSWAGQAVKEHTVAAVLLKEQVVMFPDAGQLTASAAGHRLQISPGKGGPEHQQLAVLTPVEKGAVGHIAGLIRQRPGGIRGGKKGDRLPGGGAQILRQGERTDGSASNLEPLVTEDNKRLALGGEIESAIQTLPLPGCNRAVAVEQKGAVRPVGDKDLGAAAGSGAFKAGKEIVPSPVPVDLRGPEVPSAQKPSGG